PLAIRYLTVRLPACSATTSSSCFDFKCCRDSRDLHSFPTRRSSDLGIFGLNTRGTLFAVQKALPMFNDGGSILMTGSIASVKGWPDWSVYAASKAALRAYARVWLSELKDRRIRVNVLSPGQIATPIQQELFDGETKQAFESLIPRGEMGHPEEIATAALFLASDDSSYVNGLEVAVDGGTSAI